MDIAPTEHREQLLEALEATPGYTRDVKQFVAFLRTNARELNADTVLGYVEHLKAHNYAASTYNLKLTAMKQAIRHLFANRPGEIDHVKAYKIEQFLGSLSNRKIQSHAVDPEKVLTKREIEILTNAASQRMSLIIRFLYHTGLRVSEMCSIQLSDIKENGTYAHVRVLGKGEKERWIKVEKSLYAEVRTVFGGQLYLFETQSHYRTRKDGTMQGGKPYNRSYVTAQIAKLGKRILGKDSVSAHSLRHSFATHMIQAGKSLKAVSNYLGHSSVATTADLYVHDELDLEDLPL